MSSSSSTSTLWKLQKSFRSSEEDVTALNPQPNVSNRTRLGQFSEEEIVSEISVTDTIAGRMFDEDLPERFLDLFEEDVCYDGSFQKDKLSRSFLGLSLHTLCGFSCKKNVLYSIHPGLRSQCFPQQQELVRQNQFALVGDQQRLVDTYWDTQMTGISLLLQGCMDSTTRLQELETSFHGMIKLVSVITGLQNHSNVQREEIHATEHRMDLETACRCGVDDQTATMQENIFMLRDAGLLDVVSQLAILRKELTLKEHRYIEQQKQLIGHVLEMRGYVSSVWTTFINEAPQLQYADAATQWMSNAPLRVDEPCLRKIEQEAGVSERAPQLMKFAQSLSKFLTVIVTFVSKSKVLQGKFTVAHAKRAETQKKALSDFFMTVAQSCKLIATGCGDILNTLEGIRGRDEQQQFYLRNHMLTQGKDIVLQNQHGAAHRSNGIGETPTMQRFLSNIGGPVALTRMNSTNTGKGTQETALGRVASNTVHQNRASSTLYVRNSNSNHHHNSTMHMKQNTTNISKSSSTPNVASLNHALHSHGITSSNTSTSSSSSMSHNQNHVNSPHIHATHVDVSSIFEYITYSLQQRRDSLEQYQLPSTSGQVTHSLLQTPLMDLLLFVQHALSTEDPCYSEYHACNAPHEEYKTALTARQHAQRETQPEIFCPNQRVYMLALLLYYSVTAAPVSFQYPCPATIERLLYITQYMKISGSQGTYLPRLLATLYETQPQTASPTAEPHTLEKQQHSLMKMQYAGLQLCLQCQSNIKKLEQEQCFTLFPNNHRAQEQYYVALLHEYHCSGKLQPVEIIECPTFSRIQHVYKHTSIDIVPIECEQSTFCIHPCTILTAYKASEIEVSPRIQGLRLCLYSLQKHKIAAEISLVHTDVIQEAWKSIRIVSAHRKTRMSISSPAILENKSLPVTNVPSGISNNTVLLPLPRSAPPATQPVQEMKRSELQSAYHSIGNHHTTLTKYVLLCVSELQADFVRTVLVCACTGEDVAKCLVSQPRIFQFFLSFWTDFSSMQCAEIYKRQQVPESFLPDVSLLVDAYLQHVANAYTNSMTVISRILSTSPTHNTNDVSMITALAKELACIVVCITPAVTQQQPSSVPNLPPSTSFYHFSPATVVEYTMKQVPNMLESALNPFLGVLHAHQANQLCAIEETWYLFTQSFSTTSSSTEDSTMMHVRSILDHPPVPLPFYLTSVLKTSFFVHESSVNITGLTSVNRVFACLTTCGRLYVYQTQSAKLPLVTLDQVSWRLIHSSETPLQFTLVLRHKKYKSGVFGSLKDTITDTISSFKWRTMETFTFHCDLAEQADTWLGYQSEFCKVHVLPPPLELQARKLEETPIDVCDFNVVLKSIGMNRSGFQAYYDINVSSQFPDSSFYPIYKNLYIEEQREVLSNEVIALQTERKGLSLDTNSSSTVHSILEFGEQFSASSPLPTQPLLTPPKLLTPQPSLFTDTEFDVNVLLPNVVINTYNSNDNNNTTLNTSPPSSSNRVSRSEILHVAPPGLRTPRDPLPEIPPAYVQSFHTQAPKRSLTVQVCESTPQQSDDDSGMLIANPFTHSTALLIAQSLLIPDSPPRHDDIVTSNIATYSLVAENPFASPSLSRADSDPYSSNESFHDPYHRPK